MRPIDADALKYRREEYGGHDDVPMEERRKGILYLLKEDIDEAPTIDAVPVGAYEQTRWERDMAISQLEEIGKSLCEKMDNVATVVRCKDCEFWQQARPNSGNCGMGFSPIAYADDFCSFGERRGDG